MNLKDYLKEFLEHLEIELNRSSKTIENYQHYLERFLNWSGCKSPKDITLNTVKKFRLHINRQEDKRGQKLKKITQNYHVIALRNFLKYLAKQDIETLAAEKIEVGKNPAQAIEFLETDELDRLLKSASGNSLKALRDRAILELLFSAGLRVSELVNINRDQINLDKQEFSVRGKGEKIRIVFVSDTAKDSLQKYLDKRTDIDPALFTRLPLRGTSGQVRLKNAEKKRKETEEVQKKEVDDLRITPRSIQRIVKYYASKAGLVKDVHPHTLRHSFATDLLANGADIRSVQAMLGHSSITTTQIYTHVTNQQLKEVHRQYHGRKKYEV